MTDKPCLPNLPIEILSSIIVLLPIDKTADLRSLCLTSKSLYRVAVHRLARHVRVSAPNHFEAGVRCFSRNAGLPEHMRYLTLRGRVSTRYDYEPRSDRHDTLLQNERLQLGADETQELARIVEQKFPDIENLADWQDQLRLGTSDAYFALLIGQAPMLRSLKMITPSSTHADGSAIHRLAKHVVTRYLLGREVFRPLLPLCNLRYLRLQHPHRSGYISAYYAVPFLFLPCLRTLHAVLIELKSWEYHTSERQRRNADQGQHEALLPKPEQVSPIENLIIEDMKITEDGLLWIVGACQSLKSLAILNQRRWPFPPDTLRSCLLQHAGTLEVLHVDGLRNKFEYDRSHQINIHPKLQDLGDVLLCLPKLRKMTIDSSFLRPIGLGSPPYSFVNILPPTLETIEVTSESDIQIRELLRNSGQEGRFNLLRRLYVGSLWLEGVLSGNTRSEDLEKDLEDLACQKGIRFLRRKLFYTFKCHSGRRDERNTQRWLSHGYIPSDDPLYYYSEDEWDAWSCASDE